MLRPARAKRARQLAVGWPVNLVNPSGQARGSILSGLPGQAPPLRRRDGRVPERGRVIVQQGLYVGNALVYAARPLGEGRQLGPRVLHALIRHDAPPHG